MQQDLEVDRVTKRYGAHTAVDALSLAVPHGSFFSILGPSGCGKTTLLRCVAGLTTPSGGAVSIAGHVVTEPPEGVGMVFQHFGLFPWMTVFGNVAYGLTVRGMPRRTAQSRVRDLVGMVGLGGFERSYPHQLSGGMQQRVGLARALAIEPRVLLMDEPFASLDAQTRDLLQLEMLRILDQRPAATIFVTHSIDEAVLMGDRIVILTGHPSTVHDVIDVGIPRPRERKAVDSDRFRVVRDYLWTVVMKGQDQPHAEAGNSNSVNRHSEGTAE
jgi:NitT/TauT family transport system ATP-binding protein